MQDKEKHYDQTHRLGYGGPGEVLHVGWGVMSAEDFEEIAALYVYVYVIISSSSGVLWIMYYAEICMRPVEAWWTGVPDASLPTKLDCATGGVTEHSRLMPAPDLTPSIYSEDAQHSSAAQMLRPIVVTNGFSICWHLSHLMYISGQETLEHEHMMLQSCSNPYLELGLSLLVLIPPSMVLRPFAIINRFSTCWLSLTYYI